MEQGMIEKIEKDNHMVRDTEVLNKNQLESRQLRCSHMDFACNSPIFPLSRTYLFRELLLKQP
jgi:hypothetical protein